ncbi:Thiol-disulfide oxidoreductase ResA [Paraliobacillus sp. PM-2]|uniref:peroxiredoxin family protein n=1 Tax=Paraliobacillus sp. PM-2 TaxID=1462524 RepID=UPI00061B9B4C|nr:Thiol-disulfide oxidoreductase ResA [Paraliobacillus sp. PM-2]
MIKRLVIILIISGMFGWAIYDFINQPDEENQTYETTEDTEVKESTDSTNEGEQEEESVGLDVGDIAPDFTLNTLTGDEVTLSDYRGKRIMLNFWATWCPPCRAEMPAMQQFFEQNNVEILAVNLTDTEDRLQDVVDFVDEFGLTFSILLDEKSELAVTYQIRPIPTTFMIDSKGVIQHKSFGPLNQEQMEQALGAMQ